MTYIENWSVFQGRLTGRVFNHPRKEDDKEVITSQIVEYDANEATVKTKSGTLYQLGLPLYDSEWGFLP